jgi:zinc D-Ala-D-Ala carboxypeptidase
MDQIGPRAARAGRASRVVLVGLAIVATAITAFAMGTVGPSAPWGSAAGVGRSTVPPAALDEPAAVDPPGVVPDRPDRAAGEAGGAAFDGVVDEADGVVVDWLAVSVFDRAMPAVGNLDPDLLDALQGAAANAEADGIGLVVNSGWRSPEYQQQLLLDAVFEHGSLEEAARWVATPETSAHVSGDAVDIGPPDAADWLSEHGAAHGLCQTYRNEPWHFELRPDAVDDGCPGMYADPTEDPRMQP